MERKTERMKPKNLILVLGALLAAFAAGNASAHHGPLDSTERDPWIDGRVDALVAAGWVKPLSRPTRELTNLQVAQLTSDALQQAPPAVDLDIPASSPEAAASSAPAATPENVSPARGLAELKAEFQKELETLGPDLARVEDRLESARQRDRSFKAIAKDALQKTGTQISGKGRFYFANYRSLGDHKAYGASDWNNIGSVDVRLRSVPVPSLLFDTTFRATRTWGMAYVDPLSTAAKLSTRWLALTCSGKPGSLTVGDFWRSYTPLTLWNNDVPVYTLLEPTSFQRIRKGLEEQFFLDHGNDWRLRGLDASTSQSWDGTAPLHSARIQVMGGLLQTASSTQCTQEYGGTQARLGFFDDALGLTASGLVLQDDPATTTMPYLASDPMSWARRQAVGSLSADGAVTVREDWKLSLDGEYARSRFQDDQQAGDSVLRDWAVRSGGSVQWRDVRVGARYLNVGPDFYSPGAQTNRYTPVTTATGYCSSNLNLEDGLPGYRATYVLQGFGRPFFAPYDRLSENFLPYGDATPNRRGFIVNGSAQLGTDGWIQPRFSAALGAKEFQPNYVRTGAGNYVLPVDSGVNTGVARTFQSLEGALVLDLAKVVDPLPKTCSVGADFKHQTSDAHAGGQALKVNTLIASLDIGPFKKVPGLGGLIFSAAYERTASRGWEYVLAGAGVTPTLSCYVPTCGAASPVSFTPRLLDIDRTVMVFGARYPVTKTFQIYGDWMMRKDAGKNDPSFDRHEQIWKLTHELTF